MVYEGRGRAPPDAQRGARARAALAPHHRQINTTAPAYRSRRSSTEARQGRKDRAVQRRPFFLGTTLFRLPGLWLTAGRVCGCCGAPCHRPTAVVVVEAHDLRLVIPVCEACAKGFDSDLMARVTRAVMPDAEPVRVGVEGRA